MKKTALLLLMALSAFIYSCESEYVYEDVEYFINEPIMMTASVFRTEAKVMQPQAIEQQGKMCLYEGYLYISEPYKGIHIVDNREPASPKNIGYIELLGNVDLSVRNNLLFADALVDLVWFDMSNPHAPVQKGRLENAFPDVLPDCGNGYGYDFDKIRSEKLKSNSVVVDWKVEKKGNELNALRIFFTIHTVREVEAETWEKPVRWLASQYIKTIYMP